MTISTQELDRLEQQANVRLQWIKDVREGRGVQVYSVRGNSLMDWSLDDHPKWDVDFDYKLIYPEAKKREPNLEDIIMVSDCGMKWNYASFNHFKGDKVYTSSRGSKSLLCWKYWKFPDDHDPVIPDESELPTIEQVQAVYSSKSSPVPEPKKRVPLTAEDWKGVWWVRNKGFEKGCVRLVTSVSQTILSFESAVLRHEHMMDDYERSQDGVTWIECSKLSEEV